MALRDAALDAKDALACLLRPDARDGHGDRLRWSDGQRRIMQQLVDGLEFELSMNDPLEYDIQTAPVTRTSCLTPFENGGENE